MNNYRKHPIIVQTDPVHNCTVVIPTTSGEMGGGGARPEPPNLARGSMARRNRVMLYDPVSDIVETMYLGTNSKVKHFYF